MVSAPQGAGLWIIPVLPRPFAACIGACELRGVPSITAAALPAWGSRLEVREELS
jgi:hypothetical protein